MTRKRKVLLVYDSATYRELATILLEASDCTVTSAGTAAEGMRLAEDGPDLILVDFNLPDINGFHAARLLRDNPRTRGIPLLGLTADDVSDVDHQAARDAGFDAFITKPIAREEFRAALAPLLATQEDP